MQNKYRKPNNGNNNGEVEEHVLTEEGFIEVQRIINETISGCFAEPDGPYSILIKDGMNRNILHATGLEKEERLEKKKVRKVYTKTYPHYVEFLRGIY